MSEPITATEAETLAALVKKATGTEMKIPQNIGDPGAWVDMLFVFSQPLWAIRFADNRRKAAARGSS